MFKKSKKYLSFILSLCMIVSMFVGVIPTAYAEGQLSSETAITAFDFDGLDPAVNGVVDEGAKTVTLTVPNGTDVKTLVPTIVVSDSATVIPLSGVAQDFSSSVTYTVTAKDGTTQNYTVTVNITSASSEKTLTVKDASVVKDITGTVITVANAVYTQELVDALDVPIGGSFKLQNFDGSSATLDIDTTLVVDTMKVVVTAKDGSTSEYTIAMQTVLINDTTLKTSNPSVVTGISDTTISVADAVYTQALVNALVAPIGGSFKLQNFDGSFATLDTNTTLVVEGMKVVVTAEDGSKAEYTIAMQAVLSNDTTLKTSNPSVVTGISETTISVADAVYTQALVSVLFAPVGGSFELQNADNKPATLDTNTTLVVEGMKVVVTAKDKVTTATYTITVDKAVLSNDTTLTTTNSSVVTGISGTKISVANAVYTKALVDALDAPVGGSFELQNFDGTLATLDTNITLVVDSMKVVVTAADNTTAIYTITFDEAPYTSPIVSSAETGSENTIVLTMDKSLTGTKGDPTAFNVTGIATNPTVTGVSISGTTVTITVSKVIVASDTNIQISYNPIGTNNLTDGTSQVKAFDTVAVTNNIKYSVKFTIIDSSSKAIEKATIEFNGETLLTDPNGKVTFDNVANGTLLEYTVSKSTYVNVIGTVDINDANLIHPNIQLVKNKVVFKVYNDSNQPIENATVTLGDLLTGTTNESGSVTFTGVENGTILYTVEATGYTKQNAPIIVNGNDVTETVTMVPKSATTYTITFVVKDGEDLVDGASVSLIDPDTSTIATATTDTSGEVVFNTIDAGNYDYSITATGFAEKTGSISVVDTNLTETVSIDYIPVETSVVITGSDTLESKLVGFVDYTDYKAVVNDQKNVEMDEKTVVWSIKDIAPTGVNIDSSTGVVTVHDTATAGSFTIVATSIRNSNVQAEKEITITKEVVVPVITIIGADNATVKLQDDSTEAYTYEVKDQYDRVVEGQTVTWSLETPVTGVSVDDNGLVTISDTTVDPSFILVATLASNGSVTTEKTVTLTKEIQVVTYVEIRDGVTPLVGSIEVETDLNTLGYLTHKDYNVVVKDQYGTVMDGKTATITLKNPVANLTVKPNGTNIFSFGGGGFTGDSSAILVATSDDDDAVSYELTVNITFKSKFTVVSEFLNGSGDVTVSLTPSGMIYANCEITNNTDVNTEVLMVVALYKNDIKGEELQGISAVSKVVNAHLLEKMKAGFLLPSDLTGYTVRVFVWDGNNIANAENVLSNLIQIP